MTRHNPMDDEGRCTATNRQGKRCGNRAILGGTVCRMHGGAAPQVRKAAELRLKEMQHSALDRMGDFLNDATHMMIQTKEGPVPVPVILGNPAVVAKVALGVLDRTGLGPHSTVNVEGSLGERLARLDEPSD